MPKLEKNSSSKRRLAPYVLAGVAVLWVLFDQLTKMWALNSLPKHESRPVIDDLLFWHLTFNPGAAFSFLAGATWVFTLLASAVVLAIVWWIPKAKNLSMPWAIAIGFLLGGTVGNLIDRLFREPGFAVGHVVDFIYTPWLVPAVYNVADIGLCIAVPLLVIFTLFNVSYETVPEKTELSEQR